MKVVIDPETVEPWKLIAGGEIKVLASGTRMMAVKSRWEGWVQIPAALSPP